jgi:hypothetical protein
MMSKVSVVGNNPIPLYQYLTDKSQNLKTGGDIKWTSRNSSLPEMERFWLALNRMWRPTIRDW